MLFAIFDFQVLLSPSYIPEQVADVLDSVMHTQVSCVTLLFLHTWCSTYM